MADTLVDLQQLLAPVQALVPVVVDVGGTEYQVTGIKIMHEHDENADAKPDNKGQTPGVGAQVKAVLMTESDVPAPTSSSSSTLP